MKRWIYSLAFLALLFGGVGQAKADTVLLDLEDSPGQTNTPHTFTFTASDASTTISFAGYQVPSFEEATHIQFTAAGGGPELLGRTWTFIPAAQGSLAFQINDGTSVNGLEFGGVVEDSFDTFLQTVSTVAGQSYTLSFLFSNGVGIPNEIVVSTSAVPEPASLTLLGLGLAGLAGYGLRRRKAMAA